MATLGNPKNTIEVLQKYKFNFEKKFGQNFLIDTHVLEKIYCCSRGDKGGLCIRDRAWYRHYDTVSGRVCQRSSGGGN